MEKIHNMEIRRMDSTQHTPHTSPSIWIGTVGTMGNNPPESEIQADAQGKIQPFSED